MARSETNPRQGSVITEFEEMSRQMHETLKTLETRVVTRTRDLEIAAEVSREVARTLDTEQLLPRLVNLTKSRFKLYHTHVYLLSDDGKTLTMEAGAGKAGQTMKKLGHAIPYDAPRSLVARAARSREAVIVNDTRAEQGFLPNPLLPKTVSEMAVPLIAGDTVIGVLDVQSDKVGRFAEDDVFVFMTLAGQVAVAVENAKVFSQVQTAQAELSRVYEMSVDMIGTANFDGYFTDLNPAWAKTLGWSTKQLKEKQVIEFIHSDDVSAAQKVMETLAQDTGSLSFETRFQAKDGSFRWLAWNATPNPEDRVVYVVTRDVTSQKDAERELAEALRRVETMYYTNLSLVGANNAQELLQAFAEGLLPTGANAQLYYYSSDARGIPEIAELVASVSTYEAPGYPVGTKLKLSDFPLTQLILDNSERIVVLEDISEHPDLINDATRIALEASNARSLMLVPLRLPSGEWVGVVVFTWKEPVKLATEQTAIYNVLKSELATVVQNRRLTEQSRQQETLLRSIIDASPDWIYMRDADLRLTLANRAFLEDQGMRAEKAIGVSLDELYGKTSLHQESALAHERRALDSRQIVRADIDQAFADGSQHVLSTTHVPVKDADGNVVGVLGLARDITTQRDQQQREQLAYALGQRLSTLLDADALMIETVSALSIAFGYYHAQVYLFDKPSNSLVLTYGLGDAGKILKEVGHAIHYDATPSLVAQAARSLAPNVAQDVRSDPNFLPNPLLPETRSEAALPLAVGNNLIGILDVQHSEAERFTETETRTLSTIAGQLAVALSNSRLFDLANRRTIELAAVAEVGLEANTRLGQDDWLQQIVEIVKERFAVYHAQVYILDKAEHRLRLAASSGQAGKAMMARGHAIPASAPQSLVARSARTPEILVANNVRAEDDFLPNPNLPFTRSELALPMIVADEVIGVLDVQSDRVNSFVVEDQAILSTLSSQLAVAISNARLLDQVKSRAEQLKTVSEVSVQASASLDLAQLMQEVVDLTRDRFNLYHAHLYILDRDENRLNLAAGAGEPGRQMMQHGHNIPFDSPRSLVARSARGGEIIVVEDVTIEETFLPNPLLPDTRSEMAVPVMLGDQVIGVLDVQSDRLANFTEEDELILGTLSSQMAVSISNARLFEETQRALAETEALYSGSERIVGASTMQEVLDALRATTMFNKFDRSSIIMFDEVWAEVRPVSMVVEAMWEKSDRPSISPVGTTYVVDQFPFIDALSREQPTIISDAETSELLDPNSKALLKRIGTTGMAIFPLVASDQWIGVATAQSTAPFEATEDEIRQATALLGQAAAVINNFRLLAEAQQTANQLRDLDRLKSEFLANMSHELRTPLNSIIGYSELLIDGVGQEIDPMSLEDLEGIHSSGQYLLALINDILDLAKIEAGRLELTRTDVNLYTILPEILEASRVLLKDKEDIELQLDLEEGLPPVPADAVRLRQIIWNLMSNAVKFTEHGSVKLSAYRKNSRILITVEDTGIGIATEHLATVFDQFHQVDGSATRRAGGTGLGLAITRHLTQLHGGEIRLDSALGKGSIFFVELPAAAPDQAAEPASSRSGNGKHQAPDGNGAKEAVPADVSPD